MDHHIVHSKVCIEFWDDPYNILEEHQFYAGYNARFSSYCTVVPFSGAEIKIFKTAF